jgi:quinol monooxygenase YgiN
VTGPVVIFSRLRARPGERDRLVGVLAPLVEAARAEAGTERYVLHHSRDDADEVWFYERYADEDALAAHRDGPAVRSVVAHLDDLLAEPPAITYATPVIGKD